MFGKEFFESFKKGDLPQMERVIFEALNELSIHICEGLEKVSGKDMLDESAYEKGISKKTPVIVEGVKGAKSTPFRKKFPTMEAFEKWSDSKEAGDYEIHRVMKEELHEEEQIDELSREMLGRYTQKAISQRDNSVGKTHEKRKEGASLAGKKRWGDKKYGLPEPRVKATEDKDIDEAKFVSSWKHSTPPVNKPVERKPEAKAAAKPKSRLGTKLSHYKTRRGSAGEVHTIDPDWDH